MTPAEVADRVNPVTYRPEVRRLPDGWQCRVVRGRGDGRDSVVYTSPTSPTNRLYLSRRGAAKEARRWIAKQLAEASPWKPA